MKLGDKLFTGKIVTDKTFVDNYNLISEDIEKKEALGWDVEALKNGRHNMFYSYAIA
jgi:hypothetical protein